MSHYEETFPIDVGTELDEGLQEIRKFYEFNGYQWRRDETPSSAQLIFDRGTPAASWWSSNMAKLATEVIVTTDDEDRLELHYRVTTTGQHLTDDDRAFWEREAQSAQAFVRGDKKLVDLRAVEENRAKKLQREHRGVALQGTAIVVFVIVSTVIIADYLGWF